MIEPPPTQYRPESVSPPGWSLQDTLGALGMSQVELADRTGLAQKTLSQIINGKAPITEGTALALERVLRTPAHFWLAREARYREFLARKDEEDLLRTHANWARSFPYKRMADLGWVEPVSKAEDKALCLLRFFGVSDKECWRNLWTAPEAAFRHMGTSLKRAEVISAWLRKGELEAQEMEVPEFDEEGFRQVITSLRPLTLDATNPGHFIREIHERCAEAGVRFLVVRELPSLGVYGVTRWFGGVPLIQQSMLLKSHDHFWFTFFHEAKHVLQKVKKHIFLEGDQHTEDDEKREEEANRFAAEILIPEAAFRRFVARRDLSGPSILAFAASIAIHPGIVVGRLQREGLLDDKHSARGLKIRCHWDR